MLFSFNPFVTSSPNCAQLSRDIRVFGEYSSECLVDIRHVLAGGGSFLKQTTGVTDVPVVLVQLELDQLGIAPLRQVEFPDRLQISVNDLVDSAARPVISRMAFTILGPVAKVDAAVGAILQGDTTVPVVGGDQEVSA